MFFKFRQLSLPLLVYPKIIKAENTPMLIAESRTALFNSLKCAGDEISQHITLFKEAYDIHLEDDETLAKTVLLSSVQEAIRHQLISVVRPYALSFITSQKDYPLAMYNVDSYVLAESVLDWILTTPRENQKPVPLFQLLEAPFKGLLNHPVRDIEKTKFTILIGDAQVMYDIPTREIPNEFTCAISGEFLINPITAKCARSDDRCTPLLLDAGTPLDRCPGGEHPCGKTLHRTPNIEIQNKISEWIMTYLSK